MNLQEAYQYLNSFINFEVVGIPAGYSEFKLEKMRILLEALGNPQKDLKIIHVAGSKGKGSVCAFISSILKEAGYKTGLYTSPHIESYHERIRVLDKNRRAVSNFIFEDAITENDFCQLVGEIKPLVERARQDPRISRLSFFEVFTAAALYFFKKAKCDFVILETGVGGRLDATNAAESLVAVLTPIGLEHTQVLGSTLSAIAKEKAGIIKSPHQKVVISGQCDEVRRVFEDRCKEFSLLPKVVGYNMFYDRKEKSAQGQIFDLRTKKRFYADLFIPLLGEHQVANAAVSLGIVESLEELNIPINSEAVYKGLKSVFWPGRFEVMEGRPLIVLDGAHTKESCEVLAQTIKEHFSNQKIVLVFGVSKEKNYLAMAEILGKIADTAILTQASHPRSMSLYDINIDINFREVLRVESVQEAILLAKHQPADVILATGSIFLISEARKLLCTSLKA